MDRLFLMLLALGAGLLVALLLTRSLRAGRERSANRARYFDAAKSLLNERRTGEGTAGFPRLSGRYRGRLVDLQAVPDTLTFRKLPALWVLVTLPEPLPLRATLDLMMRPTGLEPFSNFNGLSDQIALPAGFPETATIRSDDAASLLPEAILRPHLGLFDDPRIKELIVSPRGLRVVFLAEEADRTRYLLYRDAEMAADQLDPTRLEPVLESLLALRDDIIASQTPFQESLSA